MCSEYFDVGAPFEPYHDGETNWPFEIDCKYIIDSYTYHDAPRYIEMWFTREDLVALRDKIDKALKEESNGTKE